MSLLTPAMSEMPCFGRAEKITSRSQLGRSNEGGCAVDTPAVRDTGLWRAVRATCRPLVTMLATAMMLVWGIWPSSVWAEDDLNQQLLESLDGESKLESLEKQTDLESPLMIANRLLENTASARERLAAGILDSETASIQQKILDDFDALLDQTGSPPPSSSPPPQGTPTSQPDGGEEAPQSAGQTSGQAADDAGSEGNGAPSKDPNAAARESTERTVPGEETAAERERRLGLATSAWGHLPPKVREQMRSAFSETYLPEYDELLRRYYEALAAARNQESRAKDR